MPPVIPSVAAEMVWDGAAWPPPLGDASSVSSSSSATSSPRMRHRNDFDDDGYGDEYDEDDEYDEHDGEWLYPRACAPGKMLDQRLASRGFVKTVQVTGGDYRSFRDALLVAFAGVLAPSPPPVPEQAMAVEGTRSSGGASVAMRRLSSSTSLRSSATQTKLAERYLGLREPLIPLRKVHKDSRLRFLEPSEMASPALWTSNFLRSTVVMKGAGPVQRLYVTTADAYLQGRLGQAGGRRGKRSAANAGQSHQGWTWQRVRELSRVYDTEATKENVDKDRDDEDAEMSGVGVGVPEADALEECWAWNERFDRQTPGVVPDNAVRKRRRHHQGHRPAAILHNEVSGLTNAMSDDQFYTGRESLSTDPRTTQQRSITRSPLMERRRQAADMGRQHQPLQPNNSAGHSTRDPTSGPILPGSSPAISGRHTSHRPTKLRTTSMPPSLPPLVTSRSSPGPYATASPHNKRRFAAYGGDGRSGAPSPLKPGHMRLVDDYDDDGADQDQAHLPPMRRSTGNMSWVPSGRDASKRRRTRSPSIGANAAYAQQHRQHHNRQQDEGEPSSARSLKTKPLVSRRQTPSLATITPKWSNLSSPSPGPLDTAAAQAYYPQQHHLQQKEPRGVQVGGRGTTPGHHYATPRSAVVRGASTGPVAASGYDDMRYQADDDGDSYVGALREPQQTRDGESDLFVYEDEDEDEEDRGRLVEYESDDGDDDDDGSGDSHRRRPLRESLVSIPRQAADGVFDRGPPTPRAAYSPPQHHRQPSISQRRPSLGAQQHHNAHQYHRLGNRHPLGIVGAGAVPVAPAATTVGLPPEDEPWPGIESDGQDELDEERGDDDYYDDYDHHGGDDDASSTSGLEQASQELSLQDRQRSVAPPGSSFDYHHQMTGGDSVSRRSSSSSVPSEYPATQRASAAVDRGRVAAGQSPFLPQGGTSFDIHVDEEERRRESERVVAFA